MPEPSSLWERLLEAQKHLEAMSKTSFNAFERYKYVSAEDWIAAAREAFHKAGLLAFKTDTHVEREGETLVTRNFFTVMNPVSGERLDARLDVPIHMDKKGAQVDKQTGGATSYATKYWIRGTLMVPQEDDDPDRSGPERGSAPQGATGAPPRSFQAPADPGPQYEPSLSPGGSQGPLEVNQVSRDAEFEEKRALGKAILALHGELDDLAWTYPGRQSREALLKVGVAFLKNYKARLEAEVLRARKG